MASDSRPTEPVEGSWSPRRPQSAAEQRSTGATTQGEDAGGGSPDPEVLATQIEKTREELAETLDAIADKVSPKRVAARTTESAKEKASGAADTLKEKAAVATEAVKEKAASLKERVDDKVASRTDGPEPLDGSVRLGAGSPLLPASSTGSLADAADAGGVGLEPVGSEMPPLRPSLSQGGASSSRAPVLAGAVAAVVVVLLILRRRRS